MSAVTTATTSPTDATETADHGIIPAPLRYRAIPGERFELVAGSRIAVDAADHDALAVAERFARWLRRSTGFDLPVGGEAGAADIVATLTPSADHGEEGYTLRADSSGVHIEAATTVGLFRALTTLRQMLPAAAEATSAQPGPWTVGRCRDHGSAALRLPRDDARRRPSLLPRRRRAAPHRTRPRCTSSTSFTSISPTTRGGG